MCESEQIPELEDDQTQEILEFENKTLREIFEGFEKVSVNQLYAVMEVLHAQVQFTTLDSKKHGELIESLTDSMFTILMRLTEDFPENEKRRMRKGLMNQEFLQRAHELWGEMIEELDDKFNHPKD